MPVSQKQKDCLILGSAILLGVSLFFLYDVLKINRIIHWIQRVDTIHLFFLGMFASFVGNAGVLASLPYAPVIAYLSLSLSGPVMLLLFGFLCGVAAGMGETVCYGIGAFMRKRMEEKNAKKFDLLMEKLGRSKGVLVFLAGISPIPDEFILIPLASGRYSFRKTVVFNTFGKIFLGIAVVFASSRVLDRIVGSPISFSFFAPLFLISYYLFLRIDWRKALSLDWKKTE